MIEQTNEIVHKMNSLTGEPVLRHCKALLSEVSRLPGVDGNAKMSKSLGNTLTLSATEEEIHHAVSAMYTDPTHLRVSDPGHVEGNVVFTYLDAFHSDKARVAEMKTHYQRGGLGDRQCKMSWRPACRRYWRRSANAGPLLFRIKGCCWSCCARAANAPTTSHSRRCMR